MFFPFTVAATRLSLLSELPPVLQALKEKEISASKAAVVVSFTILCTWIVAPLENCRSLRVPGLLDGLENGLL